MNQTVAILFFSRTAQADAQAKPLALGKIQAEKVAALAIQQTKKTALATGLPVFHFSEKQQRGDTFGERFANAFEDIYARGFETVIAIGNDCLTLSANDILTAAASLQIPSSHGVANEVVLGPSSDGGVYLLGFKKQKFQKKYFLNINWQTENVFSQLCLASQNIKILRVLSDIDNAHDLTQQLKCIHIRLQKAILNIITELSDSIQKPISIFVLKVYLSLKSLRAPPIF